MVTDMDYVSYSTDNIQKLLYSFSLVNIYNKKKLQAADSLKFACTLNSLQKHSRWLTPVD